MKVDRLAIRLAIQCLLVSSLFADSIGTALATPHVTWTRIAVALAPPARAAEAMAYDPISRKIVMFGGFTATGYLDDTWTFDGRSWARIIPPAGVEPPGRAGGNMAYDARTKTLVLFGGYRRPNRLSDTWIWDGAHSVWKLAQTKTSPPPMTGAAVFTDPHDGHAVVFGGDAGMFYQNATWRWTGMTWRKLTPATSPYARAFMIAGTDPRRGSTVIFGGLADVNPVNTWTWNGTDWVQQFPAQQPAQRYSAGTAYDAALGAVVAFAGGSGGVDLNDTWAWAGTSWVFLPATASPSVRESFGMAYDAALQHIVVFGGLSGQTLLDDTWELTP